MTEARWEQTISALAERIARCEQYDKSVNGNIREIKDALRRMEDKLDKRLERMEDADSTRTTNLDDRLREIDRHVWKLLVKVGVIWALANAGFLAVVGLIIRSTLNGGA